MSQEVNGELVPVGGGDPIPLIRDTLVLGRRESCDICMRLPNVSGRHCQLTFSNGYWYIQDLNSSNGVKVDGARIAPGRRLLHSGAEITLAKRKYIILYREVAGRTAMEELEEDIMSQPLLERAGLQQPRHRGEDRYGDLDAGEFLLSDEE